VNAWYNAPHRANVFEIGSTYGITIGLRHKVGRHLQLSLLANDIFDTASLRFLASEVNGVRSVYGQNYALRYVRFTAAYQFGNEDINVRERGFGNDGVRRRSN
ncbi:MAG: outer membrane beta-barrel protein, partial [Bacteroidota bacterium]